MNGCIYRTKYGECNIPNRSTEYGPMCRSDCTDKHPSNYDRIISKSPEELAEWVAGDVLNLTGGSLEMARDAWLDWLKKEAQ